jgi:hypothetical protein
MKFIINAPPGMTEEDLRGLLRGYAAATATTEAEVRQLTGETNAYSGRSRNNVDMVFNLLIVPLARIDGLLLDKDAETKDAKQDGGIAKFAVEMSAQEYAVAHYIANQLNPPF